MDSVIILLKEETTINDYGEKETEKKERLVFGKLKSVGQKEFYEGMTNGLQLEDRFVLSDYLDYDGEQEALLDGKLCKIIRTYRTETDSLELTLQRGVQNGTT